MISCRKDLRRLNAQSFCVPVVGGKGQIGLRLTQKAGCTLQRMATKSKGNLVKCYCRVRE